MLTNNDPDGVLTFAIGLASDDEMTVVDAQGLDDVVLGLRRQDDG